MLLLLLGAAALTPQAADAPMPSAPVKQKKICRAIESTGSRFLNKSCHTKAEWDEIDESSRVAASKTRSDRSDTAAAR